MSFDLKAEKICDHKIVQDLQFIQDDARTIPINRDVAVAKSLTVLRNGYLIDPNSPAFGYQLIDVDFNNNPLDPFQNLPTDIPPGKAIRFNNRQKSSDDFFELTYITSLADCPKCLGSGTYWDIALDKLGHEVVIENEAKLIQDVVKGTFTIRGSNAYYSWYGTLFEALIGGKLSDLNRLKLAMAQDVTAFFSNLKDLQNQQAKYQTLTDQERIEQLISISIQLPDQTNPSLVEVSIIFRNKAGNVKSIKRVVDRSNAMQVFSSVQDKLRLG